jgi:hypothetical protein
MIEDNLDIKQKVINVLESVNMAESRASKLDIDDFLKYVFSLNKSNSGNYHLIKIVSFIDYFTRLIKQTFISANIS